ncbi:MAG: translation elongation factor Ts [Verrucomicrobiales bacterium]|jgi:elongation factor Ts|nr:translation elongation factor Ts [Verrucomicrobiales bacterium]MEC7812560.1 translation elongation factor Ts [Verrucomicrobiota bacterium]|tara:strand:+ start:872 stop:1705 length:834 start_codon:yes stop_codon:yes gene_type:complete
MAEITAKLVAQLRGMTSAGLMDCKNALTETDGDVDAAVDVLRAQGTIKAAKKAGREANEGVIAHYIQPDSKSGVLVEINCETDFVAKNEQFLEFTSEVAKLKLSAPDSDFEELRTAQVAKIGENILLSRDAKLDVEGIGLVAAYIHTGAKVGVLLQVGAGKEDTLGNDDFKVLVKDITLHIAASAPVSVSRDEVDPEQVAKEKAIAEEQAEGKPPQAIENIVNGKLNKFFATNCLLEQGFVKNPDVSIKDHVASVGQALGDEITVSNFLRFQVGESF